MFKTKLLSGLILLLFVCGCSKKGTSHYISKRNEYTFTYPANWQVLDDERKLTDLREKINSKSTQYNFPMNPDAIFKGNDKLGAMVIILDIPLKSISEDKLFESLSKSERLLGLHLKDSKLETINGKKFRVAVNKSAGNATTISALTFSNSKLYNFQFTSATSEFEKWQPKFITFISTINFNKESIQKIKNEMKENKPGFFTGLWHGFLVIFRLIGSMFWDISVFKSNSGTSYTIGFILGALAFFGGAGSKR